MIKTFHRDGRGLGGPMATATSSPRLDGMQKFREQGHLANVLSDGASPAVEGAQRGMVARIVGDGPPETSKSPGDAKIPVHRNTADGPAQAGPGTVPSSGAFSASGEDARPRHATAPAGRNPYVEGDSSWCARAC